MPPATRTLKLYIWKGILTDYSPGLAVAIAPDLRTAKAAVRKSVGFPSPTLEQDLRAVRPLTVKITADTPAQAWAVFGGG